VRSGSVSGFGVEAEAGLPKLLNLVAKLRRLLELEVASVPVHLLLELLDLRDHIGRAHLAGPPLLLLADPLTAPRNYARTFHDVLHCLLDRLRLDAVRLVESNLLRASPVRLVDCPLHRSGDSIGVQDRLPLHIARGSAARLDQRALRAQKALLVRGEAGDERDPR